MNPYNVPNPPNTSNHRKSWTADEEVNLISRYLAGDSLQALATRHKRYCTTTVQRLQKLQLIDDEYKPLVIPGGYDNPIEGIQNWKTIYKYEDSHLERENTMNIETRIFINGRDAASYSEDDLIQLIQRAEDQLAKLEGIATQSEVINAKKDKLNTFAGKVAEILDARK